MPSSAVATSTTINPDLANERKKCSFDVEELARYWIGDEHKLAEKRTLGKGFLVKRFIKY